MNELISAFSHAVIKLNFRLIILAKLMGNLINNCFMLAAGRQVGCLRKPCILTTNEAWQYKETDRRLPSQFLEGVRQSINPSWSD